MMLENIRNAMPDEDIAPGSKLNTFIEESAMLIHSMYEWQDAIDAQFRELNGVHAQFRALDVAHAHGRELDALGAINFIPITVHIGYEKTCDHKWITYEGFTESYKYCAHCDQKA